ncbi:MAG: ABC transporter substrate-binding protein [Lachnospiraceae bacterium]|nr:ABC transporter substrate-binding protein [Lachnospiraceae bacterium]
MKLKKITAFAAGTVLAAGLFAGCGSGTADTAAESTSAVSSAESAAETEETEETASTGTKTLVIGDTTFNASNEEADVNPHNTYAGWACIRYGIGETLIKYSDEMEIEPWLATEWENTDENTWVITLRDGVTFSSGRAMDAEAVKECLEHLIEVHDRAASDLKIESIEADGQVLTITTSEPKPALLNYLGDPYGCIIDVEAGFDDGIVAGTGPYIAEDLLTDDHLDLVKNENYWGGEPKIDQITIKTITDGNTLANALQSGEVQAAYGMAYESYPLFENDNYQFSQIATSRCFFTKMNFDEGSVCSDPAVRKAIAMGIDKESFVDVLLEGNGFAANGVFPDGFAFGGDQVTTETYDPEAAMKVLEDAGWVDEDGDGIREKDGQKLEITWVTYPSRQELPLLAESAQATLKDIGIDVEVNSTADHNEVVKDQSKWDVYAMANVACPTGDPEYWFTVFAVTDAARNHGGYSSEKLDELEAEMSKTFDVDKRAELAIEMQQTILDDNAFIFCSFLKMSMISQSNVSNYTSHACDYYQITADLDIEL